MILLTVLGQREETAAIFHHGFHSRSLSWPKLGRMSKTIQLTIIFQNESISMTVGTSPTMIGMQDQMVLNTVHVLGPEETNIKYRKVEPSLISG